VSLSDEILRQPSKLATLRRELHLLLTRAGARSAFLVDETGTPFAAQGNVEFTYPHPLSTLLSGGGTTLLEALVGARSGEERPEQEDILVERAGSRALLALVLPEGTTRYRRRAAARHLRRVASAAAKLLGPSRAPRLRWPPEGSA
jgi:hypothetical protein